jgi:CRP-like cAMP-binding protein
MLRLASPTAVEAMAAASRTEALPADTVVVRQGEPTDDFYAVLDGQVVVDVTHVLGGVERVRFLGPGSGFGELGLLQRSPRTATVTTVTPSVLVRVPGEVFVRSVGPGAAYGGFGPGAAILDYVMAR